MSWYKLAKDYVRNIELKQPKLPVNIPQESTKNPEDITLENKLENNKDKSITFNPTDLLNSGDDTYKAGGCGALYNAAEHQINMPEGGKDNYTKTTYWNTN